MSNPSASRRYGAQLLSVPVLLLIWEVGVRSLGVHPEKLPAPSAVLMTIWVDRALFAEAVITTLNETLLGLGAAILFGIASGIAFSRFRLLERMLLPYFVASQAVPIIAFGAIIIIWFGNGIASKAVIAFYLSFFPVAVNTLSGVRRVSSNEVGLLRTFGAGNFTILRKLQLPTALPSIFTAIRLGASLALIGAIVGEWFGASRGLGVVLLSAMFDYRIEHLWAGILLTGVTGAGLFVVIVFIQRRIAWWDTEV